MSDCANTSNTRLAVLHAGNAFGSRGLSGPVERIYPRSATLRAEAHAPQFRIRVRKPLRGSRLRRSKLRVAQPATQAAPPATRSRLDHPHAPG